MDRPRESLLTVDEACRILRVSRWTLGRWIEAGKLSARKVGHRVLVPADEIERLLDQSKVVVRGLPTPPGWLQRVSPEAASKGAELISIVLSKTGLDINPEGLKPLLRGEEPPTPLFWNALIAGLRRLLTPAETEHDTAKIQQYVQEWIERGKPGQLWDASTWDIGTSEPKKQRRKT